MTQAWPAMRRIAAGAPDWPTQLGDLKDEPRSLWTAGNGSLRLLALRSVAIVGARAATPYGMTAASELAAGLAGAGWVVISGAAFGIDSAAHRGAMVSGGCTVAVVAGGLDVAVPRARAPLIARVCDSGLAVTEHPAGSTPRKSTFLERNRLIAALTRAVVVVEAGARSGSLNTARWAESLRRPVLAVPGPMTSAASVGTHNLIRDGRAILVASVRDVLEVIEPIGAVSAADPGSGAQPEGTSDTAERARVHGTLDFEPKPLSRVAELAGMADAAVLRELMTLRDRGRAHQTPAGWIAGHQNEHGSR